MKKKNNLSYIATKTTGRMVMVDSYAYSVMFNRDEITIYEHFTNSYLFTLVKLTQRLNDTKK